MSPGDVVATFSDDLGEWTAAQVIALDPETQTVDVLDLNWSGPEPHSVADIAADKPLRGVGGALSREWLLPRSHKVIGNAPLLRTRPSGRFTTGWRTGEMLLWHRMKSADRHWDLTRIVTRLGETRLHRLLEDPAFRDEDATHLELVPGPDLGPFVDCERLATAYPNLVSLTIWGAMGTLQHAGALNRLTRLRSLELEEVFGMSAHDIADPNQLIRLEYIAIESVPAEYAAAMRRAWRTETPHGVYLSVTKPRKSEWVAQNLSNPLRGWDGREGIPRRTYAKARAAWTQTTTPILVNLQQAMPHPERLSQLGALGRGFAQAFDAVSGPSHTIETQERDELLDGLAKLIGQADIAPGVDRNLVIQTVLHAVNEERDW